MTNKMAPQNKIFNLLLFSTILLFASLRLVFGQHYSGSIRCLERERQALLKFKQELVDEHGRLSSWGVGIKRRECCKWRGVHCHNRTNHVIQLNLGGSQEFYYAPLEGKISPYLVELKRLTHLDLSYNDFDYSNIPEFIGSFEKLQYLNLSYANFGNSIPPSVGNLSELIYLDLSRNFALYSENLDWVSHLGSLKYLDLSYIDLRKASNWLKAISKLSSIKELHMAHCRLEDIHPSSLPSINASAPLAVLDLSWNYHISSSMFQWFLNFSKSLTFIDLSYNNLTSLISTHSFDNQIFLSHLDLVHNALEDGIPKSFGNMSSLIYLNLEGNHLTAQLSGLMMNLSGPLEKKLQHLDLSGNMISGPLPNFSRFSSLNLLDLGGNNLNDSISNGFLNIPNLIHLDLSSNQFTGTIPDLTFSPFLKRLYVKNNMFNGHLRESIGCLSKLEVLLLSSNQLEGMITEVHLFNLSQLKELDLSYNSLLIVNCSPRWIPPFQLTRLSLSQCKIGPSFPQWLEFQKNLEFLDLSSNNLSGRIPQNIGFLVKLESLDLSRNYLYGDIPISFSELRFLKVLDLSYNKLSGRIPLQIAKFGESAYMGNSGLCGYPTRKSCPEEDDDTMKEHEDDKLITEGFYIYMGLGFFLGLWGVCIFQIVELSNTGLRRRTQN